jgi:ribosomal protein S18 acetylase RimI-like enzyme
MLRNPNLVLIVAIQDDAEELVTLRIAAMQESLERIGRFSPEQARARFLESFQPEHTRHIVVDGQRIGFVMIRPDDGGLYLDHLYIHPDFQNRGLGSRVLRMILKEADEANLSVKVGALKESDSNRFYIAHGFKLIEEGEWDNFYTRPPLRPT